MKTIHKDIFGDEIKVDDYVICQAHRMLLHGTVIGFTPHKVRVVTPSDVEREKRREEYVRAGRKWYGGETGRIYSLFTPDNIAIRTKAADTVT